MANIFTFYVLLLLSLSPPFFHHTIFLTEANANFIQSECHNAEVPATCIQCLNSDPHGKNAKIKLQIANIIISCLTNHATILVANMSTLATKSDQNVSKKAFERCGRLLSWAKHKLAGATQRLDKGRFDSAERSVYQAIKLEFRCVVEIGGGVIKFEVPTGVSFKLRVFEQLAEAATRIIERL